MPDPAPTISAVLDIACSGNRECLLDGGHSISRLPQKRDQALLAGQMQRTHRHERVALLQMRECVVAHAEVAGDEQALLGGVEHARRHANPFRQRKLQRPDRAEPALQIELHHRLGKIFHAPVKTRGRLQHLDLVRLRRAGKRPELQLQRFQADGLHAPRLRFLRQPKVQRYQSGLHAALLARGHREQHCRHPWPEEPRRLAWHARLSQRLADNSVVVW